MIKQHFNLVDEAWIPVVDVGLVSLHDVFTYANLRALGGTALQKIALYKLLIAIAQAAYTPKDDADWAKIGADGLAKKVINYLEKWHDNFWLYGEKPFLQMRSVYQAEQQTYGAIIPEVASGNTTILTQWQVATHLSDSDKALLLIMNMGCCFGGKKTDKKVVLSKGHSKGSAKSGPSLCSRGLLHTFMTDNTLQETIWLNVHSYTDIQSNRIFTEDVGTPPWEVMPQGEICETAVKLKKSLMGRLVPVARFCLLEDDVLRYVEGIQHQDYQSGYVDPSMSILEGGSKNRMLWADPSKRPWRSLIALLSFVVDQNASDGFKCLNVSIGIRRLQKIENRSFGIWSGGIRLSSNAGEQYLSGDDDMVESEVLLHTNTINNTEWFPRLQKEMTTLDSISKNLYGSVTGYFKSFNNADTKKFAESATHLYWQLAEQHFQNLLDACNEEENTERQAVMKNMLKAAETAFNVTCPQDTARQMQAWAKCRPRLGRLLSN